MSRADQSDWPAHLRDDASSWSCAKCRRRTYDIEQFGKVCGMTQPSGHKCNGKFGYPSVDISDRWYPR